MAEKLTAQQEMAVRNRGGKLLVSAAAGSGKTKVLVDRLLSYIQDEENPANVDDFLIITYTKAAATELRGKIGAKLTEKIAENPENRHMQQQIQRLYLAKISTVHSFCAEILREYAYRMDLSGDFRVADETECQEIQLEVLDKILNDAYENAQNDTDFCAFIDTQGLGRDDRKIPEIILSVYNSARCHLNPDQWLDWCVNSCNVNGVSDPSETVWGKFLVEDLKEYVLLQYKAMEKCAKLAEANDTMEKPAALLHGTADQLKELSQFTTWDQIASFPGIDYGRLTFAKSCSDLDLAEKIKAVRKACKEGIEKKLRSFAEPGNQILKDLQATEPAARGLKNLVVAFWEAYSQTKKNRHILDFSDLEHRTLDLLLGKNRSSPTAAANDIGERFREIMVDEYQDSNEVQDAIFTALTHSKENCFMVGDVKQSIYRFRLADPGIFLQKYNRYVPAEEAEERAGRKVLLSSNFRSSGGVIQAVNDVFTTCMSPKVGGLTYGKDEMLYEGIPHADLPEPEVELYGLEVQEEAYPEEAAFAASRVYELLHGEHMIRDGDELRRIRPDDIAILLRSPGSVGAEFQYALEKRGILCTTGDSTDLLSTEEISTLVSFLQIIDNPLQDIPLLAVLASPVFGFTSDNLAKLRGTNRKDDIYGLLQASQSAKCVEFMGILNELRQNARAYTVSELLEKIYLKTGFSYVYGAMDDGEVRTANLQAFRQVVSNFESNGKKDLFHFLQYLENASQKGLTVPAEQSGAGAVTIMSIHKSKGLEFPVVLLCGLAKSFNMEDTRDQVLCHKDLGLGLCCVDNKLRVRYPTIAKKAIAVKIMEESISEEMRVLYVAMTRARDRLIMTYAPRNLEKALTDLVQRMEICDRELMTSEVSCPGSWVIQTALRRLEAGEFFQLGGHPSCAVLGNPIWKIGVVKAPEEDVSSQIDEKVKQELSPELLNRMKASLAYIYPHQNATSTPSKQTATQLKGREKDKEAAEYAKPAFAQQFRKADFHHDHTEGKNRGTAVHAVMQFISYEKCGTIQGVQDEIERMVDTNLITPEQSLMVDPAMIFRFFSTDLGKKLTQNKNVLREFKFSILTDASRYYENVDGEQVLLQGVVDCALIEDDGITVIDYKTDYVTDQTLNSVAEKYRQQVLAYGDALSRIYEKPIKTSYLYFFSLNQFYQV